MLAYTYIKQGEFQLLDKPRPTLLHPRDAIVKVTLGSICTSDLHIKHGSVPRAVPGITVGHEMVGVVTEVGEAAVSYTHLDVYKRQAQSIGAGAGGLGFQCLQRPGPTHLIGSNTLHIVFQVDYIDHR